MLLCRHGVGRACCVNSGLHPLTHCARQELKLQIANLEGAVLPVRVFHVFVFGTHARANADVLSITTEKARAARLATRQWRNTHTPSPARQRAPQQSACSLSKTRRNHGACTRSIPRITRLPSSRYGVRPDSTREAGC
jgi:microcystin degradation protein MlrC